MKVTFYKAWQKRATWLDKAIAVFSFGNYSHAELQFPNGECFSISARDKKVRFKKINIDNDRWDTVKLTKPVDEKLLREKALKYTGHRYDYLGALTSITPICIQKENKCFCSEVIVDLLRQMPEYSYLKKGCNYSPSRLHKILKKERISICMKQD
jgi:hypothetical protein